MGQSLRYLTAIGCAGGAGVHAALIPSHLREGSDALVLAFAVTSLALATLAVAVSRSQHDRWALPAAAVALGSVAVAYVLSRTSGLPGLAVEPEALDPAGAVTTFTEALGAIAGVVLLTHTRRHSR